MPPRGAQHQCRLPALLFLQGQCAKVSSINDKSDWKVVRKALSVIDFTEDEVEVRALLWTPLPSHPKFTHFFWNPFLPGVPFPS